MNTVHSCAEHREQISSGKSGLKLFIVNCVLAFILDLAELMHYILVSDHENSDFKPGQMELA